MRVQKAGDRQLTLFLIATAMAKMLLYIKAYGLTPLRVIPSVFMLFLAMVFLLLSVSQFVQIPVMRVSVWVFAAGFTVMALCGMDGKIASGLNREKQAAFAALREMQVYPTGQEKAEICLR